MPNWCSNALTISGDEQTITQIKRILRSLKNKKDISIEEIEAERDKVLQRTKDESEREQLRREYEAKINSARVSNEHKHTDRSVFRNLIGLPEGVTQEEYNSNWYDNNINWYGTKWDIEFEEDQWDLDDNTFISASFETAWSPPCPFAETLLRKFTGITEITLLYDECGCDFAGKFETTRDENGEINVFDDCLSYEEGMYRYDNDHFWVRFEEDVLEYEVAENDTTLEEILERYHFVDDEDMEQIKKLTLQKLKELKEDEQEA